LAAKPEVVAVSKCDLTGSREVHQRLERELAKPVLAISAVTGQGLADLVRSVVALLSEAPAEAVQ
jgi:predicted GTPase